MTWRDLFKRKIVFKCDKSLKLSHAEMNLQIYLIPFLFFLTAGMSFARDQPKAYYVGYVACIVEDILPEVKTEIFLEEHSLMIKIFGPTLDEDVEQSFRLA